ncbi:hypothetical protein [Antarctobacter jejuensis]|uniref:hypothetical protein n=1 Tax=Antarctobacter jejuensis TaxID=1439938 RepID=UPI003FD570E1
MAAPLRLIATTLLVAATALPVQAQDSACHDRIAAMFTGGALDPFVRPPHRFTNTVTSPEGDTRYAFLTIWDSPARSISGIIGTGPFTLVIDGDSWTGPAPEGPWTAAPNMLPDDYEGFQRAQLAQMLANLTDTTCHGTVELDGTTYDKVEYVSRTDPNEDMGGAWFGGRNIVYLDPDSQRVMRWELTDFVSSFAPELNKDIHVQVFTYDPSISLSRPD